MTSAPKSVCGDSLTINTWMLMGVALDGWWGDCHSLCQRQLQELHLVAVPFMTVRRCIFKCTHICIKKGFFSGSELKRSQRGEAPCSHPSVHDSQTTAGWCSAGWCSWQHWGGGGSAMMHRGEQIGQSSETWQVSFLEGQPHRWTDPPADPPPAGLC